MKSTIPSTSGVGQDSGRNGVSLRLEPSGKGQNSDLDLTFPSRTGIPVRAAWRVVHATAGDHPLIHQLLVSLFHRPSATEFQAQLDDPTYEPSDRLLIKNGSQIIAHLRVLDREMRFGKVVLPVGLITDLATLPEYRGHGCATALLDAARKQLLHAGAVLGLLRTEQPRFYARQGWTVCGRHCYSVAGPRDILSYLQMHEAEQLHAAESVLEPPHRKKYNIRLWRHVEQAALVRLYKQNVLHAFGALERSDAYWQWLVRRGGNERIYVAIDGPDRLELDESLSPIVGYAATKEGRILEIMCAENHPEASIQLLSRACGDAIERDFHRVRVDAPPGHPLHALFAAAGGHHSLHEADQGLVFMVNLFKPRRYIKLLSRALGERAKEGGLRRPCQLGLLVNDEKYQLVVSRRNVSLVPGTLGRSYLKCSHYDVIQLLLGHLDVRDAVQSGRITASTRVALETGSALLPRLPFWRPPWDDLPAV